MDELEAVIWAAMRKHRVTSPSPGAFVADMLRAALAWSAGDGEDVTSRRRQVLARDGWRTP